MYIDEWQDSFLVMYPLLQLFDRSSQKIPQAEPIFLYFLSYLICWTPTADKPDFLCRQGWYTVMILVIWLCLPLINNQHHCPKPDSSIHVAVIRPTNWSNARIAVPPSCALVSSSCLLYACTTLTYTSDLNRFLIWLVWRSRSHCTLHSVPA